MNDERVDLGNRHYAEIGQDDTGWYVNSFSIEPSDGSPEWRGFTEELKTRDDAIAAGLYDCFGGDASDWPRGFAHLAGLSY